MTTYLIVGNGVAANSAAESIRKLDPEGAISMFSKGKHNFYYVPALPEYVSGEKKIKDFTLHDEKWYEKNRIDLHLGAEITAIDPAQKTAVAKNGERFHYDRLLLACGGVSFVPPMKGVELPGVFTLRTLDDAEEIRKKAEGSKKAVVIGGGLLGLEAGNGLRKRGLEVSVVEFSPRLLPRQTDGPGAGLLQRQMEQMGFHFYLGAKTQEILPDRGALAVALAGGEKLSADLVLISAGVRPAITLAKSLNLPVDKGVKVNDFLETGLPGIYAAGDLIEHRGVYYGIWPASMEQGRIAGANMAGEQTHYQGTLPSNTLKVAGIDLVAAGEIDPDGKMESVVFKNETRNIYRKLVIREKAIIGAILLGNISGKNEIQRAINSKTDISRWEKGLADITFDFSKLMAS
jgi:nitrite reductase (NADH) large subunit